LIWATFVASGAFAQTTLSQILDTITNPDGTPFNGTVVITWNGYSGSGSGTVSRLSTSARVYNGALSVLLVPTTTASPGTYYQVVYSSSDGTVMWAETWQVPPSNTALTIAQVRQSSTKGGGGTGGGGGGQYATLPIAISQVTNLASSLSSINNALNTVQNNAATLGATVSGLSTTVTNQGTSLANLNSTVGTLTSTVSTQGTTLTGLSGTVNGLTTTVTGHGTSITALTSSLGSLTTTVAGNTISLTSLNSMVGGLSTNVTNLTNLVNGLNATVNTLSAAGTNAVFVDGEVPSGAINGVNSAFSLANPPAPASSLSLFRNGVSQTPGGDFALSGSAITFAAGSLPKTGDTLFAYYRIVGTGAATTFTDNETPGGAINGTNLSFTLASAPSPAASLRLFRNGLLLTAGDYTLSGSTITFSSATTPRMGDSLAAYYRH
jgi:hypothetical protein